MRMTVHSGVVLPDDDFINLLQVVIEFGDAVNIFLQFNLIYYPFFTILIEDCLFESSVSSFFGAVGLVSSLTPIDLSLCWMQDLTR